MNEGEASISGRDRWEGGFEVVGLDLSPTAIARAEEKAAGEQLACEFVAGDFFADGVVEGLFDLVYDRGCFHCFPGPAQQSRFAERVAGLLRPEGLWLSLIGSTDGPPREVGPPRHRASTVLTAIEPHFEVLELCARDFDDDRLSYARVWVMVGRRRGT